MQQNKALTDINGSCLFELTKSSWVAPNSPSVAKNASYMAGWGLFTTYIANNNYLVFREILSPVVGQNSHSPSIVHECSTLAMVYLSFLSKIHDSNAMSGVK
jgi:hypothetical protein